VTRKKKKSGTPAPEAPVAELHPEAEPRSEAEPGAETEQVPASGPSETASEPSEPASAPSDSASEPSEPVSGPSDTASEPSDPASGPLDTVLPPEGWDDAPTVDLHGEEGPTVNLVGDQVALPIRDDEAEDRAAGVEDARELTHTHLRGLLEALVFASDKPMKSGELARLASAPVKQVRELLAELRASYTGHGIVLDEVAGGWIFRTSVEYAPFVRELASEKPVRLTRAQVETLAIVAYRQPITRPEVDDIRGVDSGATMKLLLERDLVRILGKKDEPGRPLLYGTTNQFLEFFGLKSLKDLPTLKEFTELSDESRRVAEAELGEVLPGAADAASTSVDVAPAAAAGAEPVDAHSDTLTPPPEHDTIAPPSPPPTDSEIEGTGEG
jgi:segregation and condensation protein B